MNFNALEVAEDTMIIFGVTYSVSNIQTILGIVMLVIQIILILVKTGIAVYNKIKNKDYKGAITDVGNASSQIQTLVDKTKEDANKQDSK